MRFKKIAISLIMTSLLLAGCGSGSSAVSEQEVKLSDTGAYTTTAENTAEQIFTSDDGVVIIKPTPQEIIIEDTSGNASAGAIHDDADKPSDKKRQAEKTFTMPNETKAGFNGSVGQLSIEKISLNMNVFETDNEMEDMKKGAAHFKDTSVWEGNIGLSAVRPDRALLKVA